VAAAPTAGATEAVIYARAGTLYFKNAGGTESAVGSSAAAGANNQVQVNSAGAFGASTNLWYDSTTGLYITGTLTTSGVSTLTGDVTFGGNILADADETKTIFGTVTTAGNTITIGGGGTVVTAGDLKVGGNDIQASDGNANITLTSNTLTAFAGDIRVNGNDIQASDGNTNITLTSNTLTTVAGDLKVGGNDIQASDGTVALTFTGANVAVAGDLTVTGNDIKASGGTTVLTLNGANATFAGAVTVGGNLYVQGTTTEVSSTVVVINDRVIQLGTGSTVATDTFERGVRFLYGDGASVQTGFMGYTRDTNYFVFADQSTESPTDQFTINRTAPISASNGRFGFIDVGGSGAGVSNSNINTIGSNPLTLLAGNNNITNVANVFTVSGTAGGTPSIRLVDSNIQVRDVNDGGQQFAFTSGDGSSTRGKLETASGATPDLILSGGQNVDIDAGGTVRFQTVHMGAALKSLTLASGEVTQFNTNFNSAVSIFQAMNTLRAVKAVKVIDSTYNNGTILSASAMVTGDGTAFNTWWTTKAVADVATRNDRVSVYYNGQLLLSQSYSASNYDYTFNHTSADVTFNFSMTTDDIAIVKVE
jgi:hypothetical protein